MNWWLSVYDTVDCWTVRSTKFGCKQAKLLDIWLSMNNLLIWYLQKANCIESGFIQMVIGWVNMSPHEASLPVWARCLSSRAICEWADGGINVMSKVEWIRRVGCIVQLSIRLPVTHKIRCGWAHLLSKKSLTTVTRSGEHSVNTITP